MQTMMTSNPKKEVLHYNFKFKAALPRGHTQCHKCKNQSYFFGSKLNRYLGKDTYPDDNEKYRICNGNKNKSSQV